MKWIEYQILQSAVGEQVVLANKKIGYNDENLAIARKEAYNGYNIVDDEQSYDKEPIAVEFGGTGARDAETARKNLDAVGFDDYDGLTVKSGNPVSHNLKAGRGITAVTVIEPKQAGNGNPYPAGGGKNLLDKNAVVKGYAIGNTGYPYADSAYCYTNPIAVTPGSHYAFTAVDWYTFHSNNGEPLSTNLIGGTNAGNTMKAPDGAKYLRASIRIDKLDSAQIELGSAPTDYAPYSNIRPITGYNALGLMRAGKNLIGPPVPLSYSLQNFEYDRETGTITIIKEGYAGSQAQLYFKLCDVPSSLIGKKCALSYGDWAIDQSGDSTRIYVMDQTGANIVNIWPAEEPYKNRTAVIPDGTTELRILIRIDQNNSYPVGTKLTISGLQLEIGDAATPFTPYSGAENHTVQLGQTVYGGKFDWLTGKLVAEWAMYQFTGDETPTAVDTQASGISRSNFGRLLTLPGKPNVYMSTDGYCSHMPYLGAWSVESMHAYVDNANAILCMPKSLVGETAGTVKAYLAAQYAAGTPVQIAYKLATPIEIQLDSLGIIESIEGINTLYGDSNLEVTFNHDLSLIKALQIKPEDILAEPIPVTKGGTGADDAAKARANLGITPANIGALSTNGGYVYNGLTIDKEWGYLCFAVNNKSKVQLMERNGNADANGDLIIRLFSSDGTAHKDITLKYDDAALSVANGGTGATNAAKARENLGITPANIGALSTSGGTVTGPFYVLRNENNYAYVDVKNIIDGVEHVGGFTIGADGALFLRLAAGGSALNSMQLTSAMTTFAKPVTVSSGGTGANNVADARKNLGFTFSTSEQATGDTWVNGKPIYRKAIAINVTNTSTQVNVVEFDEAINMINLHGYVVRAGRTDWRFPATWFGGSDNFHSFWMETSKILQARTTAALTGYVVLEYTK